MNTRVLIAVGSALLIGRLAIGDASYQQSTQITGGSMVNQLKSSPFAPKQIKKMFEATTTLSMVHGNQLAVVTAQSTEIIDLDQGAITRINNEDKTYTVTTFADMRQAIKDAPKKLEQAQAQMKQAQRQPTASATGAAASPASTAGAASSPPSTGPGAPDAQPPQLQFKFDVSLDDTGATKMVYGKMSKEQVLTIKAHVTDPNADPNQAGGNTVTYNYVTDIWTTPDPPELLAVQDFYRRYAAKMMEGVDVTALMTEMKPAINGGAGGVGAMFASQPSLGPALQEMSKKLASERAKIKGTSVLEITRVGGDTMLTTFSSPTPPPPAGPASNIGGAVTAAAAQTGEQSAASQLGSRLGSLGSTFAKAAMGSLGHKPADASTASGSGGAAASSSVVMYETTTLMSDFSQETIPPEAFQIPAGYKKVEPPALGK
jgi:hypothetical protein